MRDTTHPHLAGRLRAATVEHVVGPARRRAPARRAG